MLMEMPRSSKKTSHPKLQKRIYSFSVILSEPWLLCGDQCVSVSVKIHRNILDIVGFHTNIGFEFHIFSIFLSFSSSLSRIYSLGHYYLMGLPVGGGALSISSLRGATDELKGKRKERKRIRDKGDG